MLLLHSSEVRFPRSGAHGHNGRSASVPAGNARVTGHSVFSNRFLVWSRALPREGAAGQTRQGSSTCEGDGEMASSVKPDLRTRSTRLSQLGLCLAVVCLQFAFGGPAAAQRRANLIDKSWCGHDGGMPIVFSMRLFDNQGYSEAWFDLGMKPDLSDAAKVGRQLTPERSGPPGDGVRYYQFIPRGLRPGTTYYCRARIVTSNGQDQSDIQSFTTQP